MKIDGDAGMILIRETLEAFVDPAIASSVLFEALERARLGAPPDGPEALLDFSRRWLRPAVSGRVGESVADEVLQRVEEVFARALGPRRRERAPNTRELHVGQGPVRVLVVSGRPPLAVHLRAALGADVVGVATARDLMNARTLCHDIQPQIVILDANDPISDDIVGLVSLAARLPEGAVCLLWGCEQPQGKLLAAGLKGREVTHTPMERSSGVEPLVDLIRSRAV